MCAIACVCEQVLTCFKTWDRTQVLLRQLLVSTDNLHVVVFDDMSDDDTKERAEAMGIAVLQPHTQRNVGMTVWCGFLEGLSCFQSQSSPVQCRPVRLMFSLDIKISSHKLRRSPGCPSVHDRAGEGEGCREG